MFSIPAWAPEMVLIFSGEIFKMDWSDALFEEFIMTVDICSKLSFKTGLNSNTSLVFKFTSIITFLKFMWVKATFLFELDSISIL